MWVHENCGGKVSVYSNTRPIKWFCEKCGKIEPHMRQIDILDGHARQQYIKDLKDRMLTEKIKEWALEGVKDDYVA